MAMGIPMHGAGLRASSIERGRAEQWLVERVLNRKAPIFSFAYGGKPVREALPAWRTRTTKKRWPDGRQETTLTLSDPETKLAVRVIATRLPGTSAVEWVLRLENRGDKPTPLIEDLLALDAALPAGKDAACLLTSSQGDHNSGASFAPQDEAIPVGAKRDFGGSGGRSSNATLPFFNVAWAEQGLALAVGWSGQWKAQVARDSGGSLVLRAGQELTRFRLLPGESVRTPRMLVVAWDGDEPLRGSNLLRQTLMDWYVPRRNGEPVVSPICATANWTAADGTYEGPHLSVLPPYARLGVEVFWSDMDPQQWYPGGFPGGTGNWVVDRALYPHGLEPIGDAIKKVGLEYLLWFEPERVQQGTLTQREHPNYVYFLTGNGTGLFRMDLPEARRWMFDLLDGYVKRLHLSWIRWDFNMDPLAYWRACDADDRQGVTEMKYIEGLYALWDDLRARNPGLVIDQCASGGRRIDLETLTRGVPLWHSDMQCNGPQPAADQLQNGGLFRWVPFHGCGNFDYEPAYAFRSAMTSGNIMACGDKQGLNTSRREGEDGMRRSIAVYKKVRPLMMGDFYPLFPHLLEESEWYGYQFHNERLKAGFVLIFRRRECAGAKAIVRLHGIEPQATYELLNQDSEQKRSVRGRDLRTLTVEIADKPGSSLLFYSKAR